MAEHFRGADGSLQTGSVPCTGYRGNLIGKEALKFLTWRFGAEVLGTDICFLLCCGPFLLLILAD